MASRIGSPQWVSALVVVAIGAVAAPLAAQSISLKTVPIATGEQYLIFPSRSLGMGGLSIAYDDPLQDAFANPARGVRLEGTWLMATPTTYDDGDSRTVSGHTLPLAITFGGDWFGTATVALQEIATPDRQQFWWMPVLEDGSLLRDDAATNSYLAGSIGRSFDRGRTAIAVGAFHADLDAIDGVGQLYANSVSLSQTGSVTDLRVGVLRDLGRDRRIEGMVSKSDVDMTHDVVYLDWLPWDSLQPNVPNVRARTEENLDRTTTWSASLRYTAPGGDPGLRWGLMLIGNTKSHPKIPNYDLVNIPRDPGNSAIFGIGAGLTSRQRNTLIGAELMLQPGHSHTWAYADSATMTPGGMLQKGDKTVDNEFRFANWTMALGLEHEFEPASIQFGIRVNRYGYHLDQQNFLRDTTVATDESWIEWSPSWGGSVKLGRAEVRYSGRWVAKGFDFPGREVWAVRAEADFALPGGNDFIVAPTDPVNLPDFRVTTHRLTVVVPLTGADRQTDQRPRSRR